MMNKKLNNCKCGGKPKTRLDGLWFIICSLCSNEEGPHAYKREAINQWNKIYE